MVYISIDLYTKVELERFLGKHGFRQTGDNEDIPTFQIAVDEIITRAFAKW
jgi:hypothetical protein